MRRTVRVLAVAVVVAATAPAAAQTYPRAPTRCGERFQPDYTYVRRYTFPCFLRTAEARAAGLADAKATCGRILGARCAGAVRVVENPVTVTPRRSERRCYFALRDVYRCTADTGAPDLEATAFTASVTPAGAVTLHFKICSRGSAVPLFDAAIDYPRTRLFPGSTCPSRYNTYLVTGKGISIGARGDCLSGTLPLGVLPSGKYGMTLWADQTCTLSESDERNNWRHLTFDVRPRASDVSVTMKLSPGYPRGRDVAFDVTICRRGAQPRPVKAAITYLRSSLPPPTSSSYCGLSYTPSFAASYGYIEFPAAAGCATFYKVPVRAPYVAPGTTTTWRACFLLDHACELTESDERNNVACLLVPIKG